MEFALNRNAGLPVTDIRILTVDNSATMRRIIVNTLHRAGFNEISEATDGKDALAKMKVDNFDLVITDWNMPEMDGLTLVNHLRCDAEFRDVPVLMISARSVKEDILEAMKAGVTNYLVRPFTSETLCDKIQQVLKASGKA